MSVGEADYTTAMMKQLGDMAFWRDRHAAGPADGGRPHPGSGAGQAPAVLFGLPGNPVAVMVTFLAFVRPALLRMMGCSQTRAAAAAARAQPRSRSARSRAAPSTSAASSPRPPTARCRCAPPATRARACSARWSQANGLIVLHHAQGSVAPGDEVDVMMFDGIV